MLFDTNEVNWVCQRKKAYGGSGLSDGFAIRITVTKNGKDASGKDKWNNTLAMSKKTYQKAGFASGDKINVGTITKNGKQYIVIIKDENGYQMSVHKKEGSQTAYMKFAHNMNDPLLLPFPNPIFADFEDVSYFAGTAFFELKKTKGFERQKDIFPRSYV